MSKNSICLNMIVKNEEHVIINTLTNLCSNIIFDYWVICDTGSSDNTKKLITSFFKERDIKGELFEHEWKDFGHNRTLALECAYNKTDMLFIFDADDEIVGKLVLPNKIISDSYTFKFGCGFVYIRTLLINNRKKWGFKGVLHEYLINLEPLDNDNKKHIEGDYYIVSGRTGNRSKNPNKYIDDANILKKAHYEILNTDYNLSCRYAFYCAQSFKDSGEKYINDAIEWYKKCLTLNMWSQEQYVSCLTIGDLYFRQNDMTNALKYWYKTIEYDSERIEGIINAMQYLLVNGENLLINALYHKFKNYNKKILDKLFINSNLYKDELEYYNSIAAYYVNDKMSGYDCCKQIFLNDELPYNLMRGCVSNFNFYINLFNKDTDTNKLQLFYSFDNLIHSTSLKYDNIEQNMINTWNTLFESCRLLLTKPSKFNLRKKKQISIFISFTTCKRLDLFKETIFSMLNHWNDIDKIDYWFCVDDNSSNEDRLAMKTLFPWIKFYMKTKEEKGHRGSMNIIYKKLIELNPTYWIHMEDDFLFHKKHNYIDNSITLLNSKYCRDNNVKQILFNRNYGEIIANYNIKGHISNSTNNNIVFHKHCNGNFNYVNCHYWPHYSFRPSLIDVKTILGLGNFDSDNTFFELDYAKKWETSGYTSAFFNRITCRHIGRLTSDRNTKVVKNAYDLNNEEQFYEKTNIKSKNRIKIVNLERREDRKEETIRKLLEAGIKTEDYDFIKAVDGKLLEPSSRLKHLFRNNDFGSRRGVIGCALSHYNLWNQLLNDSDNEYYIIMEDDFTLCKNFKQQFEMLETNNEFSKRDVLFLGYHMFEKNRQTHFQVYNIESNSVDVEPLDCKLYIGGYFAYSINKNGAKILIDYIEKNGINHGIDYLNKIMHNLQSYECRPQIVFSEWNENGKQIDSDIQNIYDSIDFTKIIDITNINTSHYHRGRLGNLFLVNMALHFISKKNNIYAEYQQSDKFKQIGIELFSGTDTYEPENTIPLSDDNFFGLIIGDAINKNISIVNNVWCQTSEFVLFLRTYFDEEQQKNSIINHNKYKERYDNNDDVFIHVRLGDISDKKWCQTFDYYDKILDKMSFENGYISSDSIDNIICKTLIIKYNLKIIDYNEVETIMFASTCKHIVLSSGTFSWLIGFLAYYSDIYYPKIIHQWHGDIFVFKNWKEVEYNPDFILDIYDVLFKQKYVFIPNLDQYGNDIYYHKQSLKDNFLISEKDPNCIGFNTLGFFKNAVVKLEPSKYFKEGDGIYIKKSFYKDYINIKKHTIEKIYENDIKIMNDIFIETGSYMGDGIQAAINLGFKEIYSIELSEKYYNICKEKFKNYSYVHLLLGDSGIVLPKLIKNIKKGITFWLDGHYSSLDTACAKDYCSPIQFELMSIKTYYHKDHVILIDDMKDFTQESIDWNNNVNKKCGYITKKKLEEIIQDIYLNYKLYYYDPACVCYNSSKNINDNTIKIKMLCNWCSSEQLCKEWSNMCETGFKWKNYELVWTDVKEDIDFYVIINYPPKDSYFDPKRTIVFQMEPWVNDLNKNWGVKTFGKWADPNPNDFLAVRGRKTECHNNAFWQLELKLDDFQKTELFEKTKDNVISSICSSKYFDEGHIVRIDFLKFLEEKGNVQLDIYSQDNTHCFTNYRGQLPMIYKSNGLKQYKYYFMIENNFEKNYITEKLWEPILCETLVFYYGCPNVTDYVDPMAFVQLDITDFEKSYQIIKQAINEDWWSQRINIIRQEKHRILNELSFFPTIDKIIAQNIQNS